MVPCTEGNARQTPPWERNRQRRLLIPPQIIHEDTGPPSRPKPVFPPLVVGSPLLPVSPFHSACDKVIKVIHPAPIFAGASVDVHNPPFLHFPPPKTPLFLLPPLLHTGCPVLGRPRWKPSESAKAGYRIGLSQHRLLLSSDSEPIARTQEHPVGHVPARSSVLYFSFADFWIHCQWM